MTETTVLTEALLARAEHVYRARAASAGSFGGYHEESGNPAEWEREFSPKEMKWLT